jgi:hypothetical protein
MVSREPFDTAEAARRAGVSHARAQQYARSFELPRDEMGRFVWTMADIERLIARKLRRAPK